MLSGQRMSFAVVRRVCQNTIWMTSTLYCADMEDKNKASYFKQILWPSLRALPNCNESCIIICMASYLLCLAEVWCHTFYRFHITMTSQWARWRLKSPASRLFLNCLFSRRSKNTSKLCVTGLCGGSSPVTGEFPVQRVSNAENVSIWWRHHDSVVHHLYWDNCVMLSV